MHTIDHPTTRTYYIARDDAKVISYGFVDPTNRLDCASPYFEIYQTKQDMDLRLVALGEKPEGASIDLEANPEIAKVLINDQINAIREEKFTLPLTYGGNQFDNDDVSRANLAGILGMIDRGLRLPADFTWRSADNKNVPADVRWLGGLSTTMFVYRNKCYRASWILKAMVSASSNPSSVDLTAEWPNPARPTA
jgi:hypothetical protein